MKVPPPKLSANSRTKFPASPRKTEKSGSSSLENLFLFEWAPYNTGGYAFVREFRFHPSRKFRFDFALPKLKLAIELDGFGYGGKFGGHQTPSALAKDHEKRNLATELGWTVLTYNRPLMGSKQKRRNMIFQILNVIRLLTLSTKSKTES